MVIESTKPQDPEAARRLRQRNWVMLAILFSLIAIIFTVTIIKEHH